MEKSYKISLMISAVTTILFFLIYKLRQDQVNIDVGICVIVAFILGLVILSICMYFRSEEKRIKQNESFKK